MNYYITFLHRSTHWYGAHKVPSFLVCLVLSTLIIPCDWFILMSIVLRKYTVYARPMWTLDFIQRISPAMLMAIFRECFWFADIFLIKYIFTPFHLARLIENTLQTAGCLAQEFWGLGSESVQPVNQLKCM